MTLEELEIVVTAKVEEALKEVMKLKPEIQKQVKQIQEAMSKIDTKKMAQTIQKATNEVKKKLQVLRKSSENNEIAIKVTNEDAIKQVSQIQKEIESLQKKISERELKLSITNNALDKMRYETNQQVIKDMPEAGAKRIGQHTQLRLYSNSDYVLLEKHSDKLNSEITRYNMLLDGAKAKMAELGQETSKTATTQSKLGSFFSGLKSKISQAVSGVGGLKNNFKQISGITQKVSNNIKQMGSGMKQGLGHILKYAGALLSLRSIYSTLRQSASAWLSSQNAGAQQLSANIEYMKYAMGSALAPVIQFVTNLVYQLMRTIQSVAYALTGVNIFAKATASSMNGVAGSAKKAKEETKKLAGVHDEINNISDNNNSDNGSNSESVAPSLDLSQMENTPSSIIDAIRNGNWYEVGTTIGEKLNEVMESIPWYKIQNGTRNIATNIAQFLNGFIGTTNWNEVGNTFAQGLNTVIYFAYSFVTTFNWAQFGKAIGDSINGLFNNIDWATAGKTLSEEIKGVLDVITTALLEINWSGIGQDIVTFLVNIDWNGVVSGLCAGFGAAIGGISSLLASMLLEAIIYPLADFFLEEAQECGGSVILGLLKGIVDGLIGIGIWIYDNMIYPFITAFCNALGIHSPSTVFAGFGKNIIQGLFNGISSLLSSITGIWQKMKSTAIEVFSNIKNSIVNKVTEIKNGISQKFQEAYNSIRNIFSNIGSFFSNIWNGVKNTFSNLGTSIGNAISNAVKSGINGVISLIQNTINRAISLINGAISVINLIPGVYVSRISTLSLPRLAKGGVVDTPTVAMMGEYSGAKSNPEIVTPQNIMEETFDRVFSRHEGNNSGQPIHLTIQYLGKEIFDDTIDYINEKTRRTGKCAIKVN